MLRDIDVHLWSRRKKNIGLAKAGPHLSANLVEDMFAEDDTFAGFSFFSDPDMIYLTREPPRLFAMEDVISHETLHLTLQRIGEVFASRRLDRVSNYDDWIRRGIIGGL